MQNIWQKYKLYKTQEYIPQSWSEQECMKEHLSIMGIKVHLCDVPKTHSPGSGPSSVVGWSSWCSEVHLTHPLNLYCKKKKKKTIVIILAIIITQRMLIAVCQFLTKYFLFWIFITKIYCYNICQPSSLHKACYC